jgi:hypothetical protein
MIVKKLIFLIVSVYGAIQTLQLVESISSLAELQEHILLLQESGGGGAYSKVDVKLIANIPVAQFFKDMMSMEECSFTLFWYSYGRSICVPSKSTGWKFFQKISLKKDLGTFIFGDMKKHFKDYMNQWLLKELLSVESKANKEELLADAMALYYGKFKSIWPKLVDSKFEMFDYLQHTFFFYQKVINLGIYGTLEFLFEQIFKDLGDPLEKDLVFFYKEKFRILAVLLLKGDNEIWGLRWIADHRNPYLMLSFFYFLEYYPTFGFNFLSQIKEKNLNRKSKFWDVIRVLKYRMNFNLDFSNGKLKFAPNFKSPFQSQLIGNDELKGILSRIISKLLIFCF